MKRFRLVLQIYELFSVFYLKKIVYLVLPSPAAADTLTNVLLFTLNVIQSREFFGKLYFLNLSPSDGNRGSLLCEYRLVVGGSFQSFRDRYYASVIRNLFLLTPTSLHNIFQHNRNPSVAE